MAALHTKPPLKPSLLTSFTTRACCLHQTLLTLTTTHRRTFSTTLSHPNWLAPKAGETSKSRKGKPRVPTGGSVRGTTLVWGDYGLRLRSHDRRISAHQLKVADATIRQRLRGMKYRLYHRISATIGVYTSGNDQRMGKGKGSFDHWAARVAVSRVLFELRGEVHETIVRDAMRLAGNKLPGLYEFVRRGDPAVMGVTKVVGGNSEGFLRRPRRESEGMGHGLGMRVGAPSVEHTSRRLPGTTAV